MSESSDNSMNGQGGEPNGTRNRHRIRGVIALPPLPRHSQQLLSLLVDPDLDILQLIELIEQTPALAARIMGIASSAYFHTPKPAQNITDAVMRLLGLNLVRDISISLILSQPFSVSNCAQFDQTFYWKHAMMVATLAQLLAPLATEGAADELRPAYLAGLLHSLGMLVLADVAPEGLDEALKRRAEEPSRSLCTIQREILGIDYTAAGGEVAIAWGLPTPFTMAMIAHRDSGYSGPFAGLAALIRVADCLAKAQLRDLDPAACETSIADELRTLGIGSEGLHRALERWQQRVENIEQLARALVGVGR